MRPTWKFIICLLTIVIIFVMLWFKVNFLWQVWWQTPFLFAYGLKWLKSTFSRNDGCTIRPSFCLSQNMFFCDQYFFQFFYFVKFFFLFLYENLLPVTGDAALGNKNWMVINNFLEGGYWWVISDSKRTLLKRFYITTLYSRLDAGVHFFSCCTTSR